MMHADEEQAEQLKASLQHHKRGGIPLSYLPLILCTSDFLSYLASGLVSPELEHEEL